MAVEYRRHPRELSDIESLRLLGTTRFGRLVFTRRALPAIRPVPHIVDGDCVIIYADLGAGIFADRQVLCFEADLIDHRTLLGWCVIVTGLGEKVSDPEEIHRYRLMLPPAALGARDRIFRIHADIVTGIDFVPIADIADQRLA
ncbi:pyridoxamine 5'-phosphate oxidase family protein [Nocardia sp. NPDC052566]|uniref:pyridoxamine 5'-phosphate oxidase family protein n=1 Tax=Nocardia sp. NPDC052566 TaxID=3364330 RepID=UPI0037C584B4